MIKAYKNNSNQNNVKKEFTKLFNKEVIYELKEIEKTRLKTIFFGFLLWLAPCFFFSIISIFNFSYAMIFILIFIFIASFPLFCMPIAFFKRKARKIIFPKLLKLFGEISTCDKTNSDARYIENIELFKNSNSYYCDDRLTGFYKNNKIDIYELDLSYNSNRTGNTKPIFKGILLRVPLNKPSDDITVIKKDSLKIKENKNRVILEDVEFEKYFDVYSTNQIEARYLITTAFMDRLVSLAKKGFGNNLSISFEQKYVNIALKSSKDWFEISILKPVDDLDNYKQIVSELSDLFSIIDTLKLSEDIGL